MFLNHILIEISSTELCLDTFCLGCRVQLVCFTQELWSFWKIASSKCSNSNFYASQRFVFIAIHHDRSLHTNLPEAARDLFFGQYDNKLSYILYVEQLMRQIIDFT